MIKIDHHNISITQAFRIVDQIIEKHGNKLQGKCNFDGIVGAINYSVTMSGKGNVFVRLWREE